jgi:hypothetical protein
MAVTLQRFVVADLETTPVRVCRDQPASLSARHASGASWCRGRVGSRGGSRAIKVVPSGAHHAKAFVETAAHVALALRAGSAGGATVRAIDIVQHLHLVDGREAILEAALRIIHAHPLAWFARYPVRSSCPVIWNL